MYTRVACRSKDNCFRIAHVLEWHETHAHDWESHFFSYSILVSQWFVSIVIINYGMHSVCTLETFHTGLQNY